MGTTSSTPTHSQNGTHITNEERRRKLDIQEKIADMQHKENLVKIDAETKLKEQILRNTTETQRVAQEKIFSYADSLIPKAESIQLRDIIEFVSVLQSANCTQPVYQDLVRTLVPAGSNTELNMDEVIDRVISRCEEAESRSVTNAVV